VSYYLAPCLKALGDEVTVAWPNADKWPTVSIGDGWVGDTSHAARKSDHNPDYSAGGVVRAVDIGIAGRDADRILAAAIGDPRVWYVIHKGRIYSRTYGWVARDYSGSNPHNHHIHISARSDRAAENDTSPWGLVAEVLPDRMPKLRKISLSGVRAQFIAARDGKPVKVSPGIKRIQRRLNQLYKARLTVDGLAGPATLRAWGRHERATCGMGGARIPDKHSLAALCKGSIYRVVK
jgi:hypothetical protein